MNSLDKPRTELDVSKSGGQPVGNIFSDPKTMNVIYKAAEILAGSTMTPKEYQGNVGSCFIAAEMSLRTNLSTLMVMQQLAIVSGRPTWSGQACTALINQSRRYDKPLKICFIDKDGNDMPRYIQGKTHGAYAYAVRDGEEFYGTAITWDLVKNEGWDRPKGNMISKWTTMPEQMFKYRAASFFAREHCPDILMGCQVEGEPEDIASQQLTSDVISHDVQTAKSVLNSLVEGDDEEHEQFTLDQ